MGYFENSCRRKIIASGNIPSHVAIIMDGNGTWAKRRGLPRVAGHAQGATALRRTITECVALGIKYLSVYAFSTENWKRPKEEVDFLMNLLMESIQKETAELKKNQIMMQFKGDLSRFSSKLQKMIKKSELETNTAKPQLTLCIMLNYGSRAEIFNAINSLVSTQTKLKTEQDFSKYLYTNNIPDPDLLIRTSGQIRLSNFMLWQLAYSELWFTKKCWPDFNGKQLRSAVKSFQKRSRTLGGVK